MEYRKKSQFKKRKSTCTITAFTSRYSSTKRVIETDEATATIWINQQIENLGEVINHDSSMG